MPTTFPTRFRSPFLLGALLLVVLFSALRQEPTTESGTPSYRILIANDDGIDSPGLAALVLSFAGLGEVVVCAPPGNRSGASHSSSMFSQPMELKQGEMEGAAAVWIVDGTPSDCVTFGLVHLGKDEPFDLVVSGINHGNNVGLVAHYSGTVGAAMEGTLHGVLSIAVSQDVPRGSEGDYTLAARFAVAFAARLLREHTPADITYNVNVPFSDPEKIKGVLATPMGGAYIEVSSFEILEQDEAHFAHSRIRFNRDHPAGSDTARFYQGNITITPLRLDWTDRAMLDRIQEWGLEIER